MNTFVTINDLKKMKLSKEKITMLSCYDASFARLLSECGVDILLVGDSLGMVIQGSKNTVSVAIEHMEYHTKCVNAGNKKSLIMSDLPFMSYYNNDLLLKNSKRLMQAGANIIKIEGGSWLCDAVRTLKQYGIPTCVHMGLKPQTINAIGSFKHQKLKNYDLKNLINDAVELESYGADMILLESVSAICGNELSNKLKIPVIGIGAGPDTDGQVLVLYDILNIYNNKLRPKFIKLFVDDAYCIQSAIKKYISQVKKKEFPDKEIHSYND